MPAQAAIQVELRSQDEDLQERVAADAERHDLLLQLTLRSELLEQAAERLRETNGALRREAFMLVNGDVKIVFDRDKAAEALARGGLTSPTTPEMSWRSSART